MVVPSMGQAIPLGRRTVGVQYHNKHIETNGILASSFTIFVAAGWLHLLPGSNETETNKN